MKQNYLNFFIVIIGLPLLLIDYGSTILILRLVRGVFIIALFIPWLAIALRFLTDNRLDTTIFTAVIVLVTAGIIIVDLEPSINNLSDGIWWAWVTISTVGYGDIVPTTPIGRLFGAFLILIGMGLFSVITANFAAIFIQRSEKNSWKKSFEKVDELKAEEDLILSKLNEISNKIEKIEIKLKKT